MTRRFWLNLILLLLVLLLAAAAYFESNRQVAGTGMLPLLDLPANQVRRIEVQHRDAPALRLERTDNGWQLLAPVRVAASEYRVDGLLKLLSASSYAHFPAAQRPLSNFGLDHPLTRILFNDSAIAFGGNESLNRRRYVLVGDQVHLIDERHFYQSQLLVTALVDLALLPKDGVLSRISLPGLLLQQKGDDGGWQLSGGSVQSPVSMDDINGLVDEWQNVHAVQVSRYQSDVAEGYVELLFDNGESMTLEMLARVPELILGRKTLGLRYHFDADQGDRLLGLPSSFSELSVTGSRDD